MLAALYIINILYIIFAAYIIDVGTLMLELRCWNIDVAPLMLGH